MLEILSHLKHPYIESLTRILITVLYFDLEVAITILSSTLLLLTNIALHKLHSDHTEMHWERLTHFCTDKYERQSEKRLLTPVVIPRLVLHLYSHLSP